MPEPSQTTIYGASEPQGAALALTHWEGDQPYCVACSHHHRGACLCPDCGRATPCSTHGMRGSRQTPEPLFTAPQTMRGQLAMPTDTVQR